MNLRSVARALLAGLVAVALVNIPARADAQSARGGIGGKIVDAEGKPVADAEVTIEAPDVNLRYVVKTNAKGEWAQGGIPVGNRMTVSVKKGNLTGGMKGVPIRQGSVMEIPNITVSVSVSSADAAKAAAAKAQAAEMAKIATEVNAAVAANDYGLAITKYQEAIAKVPDCAQCYARIGDMYMKQSKQDDAEKAYLKATELDGGMADAYSSLAAIYNQQKKYDQAAKMTEKVNSLASAMGMGGDATAEFSAGAIAVNMQLTAEREGKADVAAQKMSEAMAHFQKAIQLKPDMADAYYELGMLYVKQNKIPEAKKALAEYVRLAPTGANAEMAKAIATMP